MARKKKIPPESEQPVCYPVPQTARVQRPWEIKSGLQSQRSSRRLWYSLKDNIPIIDAAIEKLVRLTGTFEIKCSDKTAQRAVNDFLKKVKTGPVSNGINSFIAQYLTELLVTGTAIGEIVTDGSEVMALSMSCSDNVELRTGENPLIPEILVDRGTGEFEPVRNPELIFVSALNPRDGNPFGTSILTGLPFVSDILLKIFNATGTNFDRIGNVRYAVTYKPQNDPQDRAVAAKRAKQIAEQWSKTMQSGGDVRDFVAVGDIEIKVIGTDNQVPDCEIPVRQMLEQIVAKLGVPPFLLGLSWSSTERMSSQQSDILTSEIEFYRETINPVIDKICAFFFRLNGYCCDFEIQWSDITLQDTLLLAQADYYRSRSQ